MLKLAQYRCWSDLQELRELWNPLLASSASDTVFLTWEWCEAWWKNYGEGRSLFVLAAWDGDELIGVAPFYIETVRLYGKQWRQIRLLGDGSHDSDYLDCFARCDREAEAMAAFGDFLEKGRKLWDWIELNGPMQDSPCMGALIRYAREKHWRVHSEPVRCATLPLTKSWQEYLSSLEPRFRTKARASLALLDGQLKSAPVGCASVAQIEEWLPVLFELHTRRWGSKNEPGVFGRPAKRKFYRDLSQAALERGWLAFHRLDWGERALALQYGLVYRNRFHLLQEGYDPDFSVLRPGVALRAWLMRHWIEAGLDEYDFLAGVSDYKLDWGAREKLATRVLLSANRLSTFAAVDWPVARSAAKEHVGRLAPASVLSMRRRILSRRGAQDRDAASRPVTRRLASAAYSATPLGSLGRAVATNYTWSRGRTRGLFPVQRRGEPVCHIFQYHRVNDDADPFLGALPLNTFRAQMEYLAATFPVLTLDQVAKGEFPNRHRYSVVITFDDGYRDNFVCAFPILKSLGIPATVFLATGYVEAGQLPWYDQVRVAFKLTTRAQFSVADLGGPSGSLSGLGERLQSCERTLGWLRGVAEGERAPALNEIFRTLGVAADLNLPNQMLRWEDIRQMAKHNITFGAHTVTHPVLSKIPAARLQREILGSKRTIENRLQTPVSHFAYPFGQPADFNAQAKESVRDAGFKTAVTTVWGVNEPNDDPFELRRFTPWDSNPADFKMKLDWYRFRELQPAHDRKVVQVEPGLVTQEGI